MCFGQGEKSIFSIPWKTDISEHRQENVLFVFKPSTLWHSKYFPNKYSSVVTSDGIQKNKTHCVRCTEHRVKVP